MMLKKDAKNLKKRYLVWFYKTAKEAWDKVERKFTQAEVDRIILKELKKADKAGIAGEFIRKFEEYLRKKEQDGLRLKFAGKKIRPDYLFFALRLQAVEKAIVRELGPAALKEIKLLYEIEMTKRILRSTEH